MYLRVNDYPCLFYLTLDIYVPCMVFGQYSPPMIKFGMFFMFYKHRNHIWRTPSSQVSQWSWVWQTKFLSLLSTQNTYGDVACGMWSLSMYHIPECEHFLSWDLKSLSCNKIRTKFRLTGWSVLCEFFDKCGHLLNSCHLVSVGWWRGGWGCKVHSVHVPI